MPDGDIIRGLQRIYQKPYEDLFEGKASNDECARSLRRFPGMDLPFDLGFDFAQPTKTER